MIFQIINEFFHSNTNVIILISEISIILASKAMGMYVIIMTMRALIYNHYYPDIQYDHFTCDTLNFARSVKKESYDFLFSFSVNHIILIC